MGLREAQGLPKVMKQPARTLSSPVLAWLLTFWAVCLFMIQILAGSILLALAYYSSAQAFRWCSDFLSGTGAREGNLPQITILEPTALPEPTFYIPAPPFP